MKRFICVLSGLLVLPAFAEVAPVYYDDVVEYTDDVSEEDSVEQKGVQQRTNINRSTSASRAISSAPASSGRANTASRAMASSPRTASGASRGTVARTTKTPATATRTATTRGGANVSRAVTSRNTQNAKPVAARVGVYGNSVMSSSAGGLSTVSGGSNRVLYNPSGSAGVNVANRRASARISTPVAPVTTSTTISQEDVTSTTSNLTNIAELTEYCKTQYAACMDNYCNILDDNQGRCSCSKNIKNYEKTEQALAAATEDFQDVVQQIRYIGLTSDQIEALFTETEAELTMKSTTDSSRLKNSLDSIKKKIVDVSTPTAASTVTNGLSLDMNGLLTADFSQGFDLNSFLNLNNNTASVSNQRGEQLYKTASGRCKTAVLNSCTTQGIDANIITNSYDLEIDKQCVLYERALSDANSEMKQNVTNAATILQQARLLLAQNKNSYDLRGCVAAIDSCMQDEYICGQDYELCLDPTGKYLANGEVVKGGTPGVSGGQPRNPKSIKTTACENIGSEPTFDSYYYGAPNDSCSNTIPTSYYESYCKLAVNQTPSSCTDCGCYSVDFKTFCRNEYLPYVEAVEAEGGCEGGIPKEDWVSEGMYNLYSTWDYDGPSSTTYNAWSVGDKESLGGYVDAWLDDWKTGYKKSDQKTYTNNMAMYLLQKIGYIDSNDKVHGMCASVMKQCQDYTFKTNKTKKSYIPANEVVRQYLTNTLAKIKTQQDAIIADYAEDCRNDVASCLATNGYDESNPNNTATKTAINACAAEITTCMSVGGYQITEGVRLTLRAMSDWVASMMLSCPENQYLVDDGTGHVDCKSCEPANVIANGGLNLSESADAPYISIGAITVPETTTLLSSWGVTNVVQMVSSGGKTTQCSCPEGYTDYIVKGDSLINGEGGIGILTCINNSIKCGKKSCSVGGNNCTAGFACVEGYCKSGNTFEFTCSKVN